ncbi:amino acid permease 6-like protein [Tanacetum coccineum]
MGRQSLRCALVNRWCFIIEGYSRLRLLCNLSIESSDGYTEINSTKKQTNEKATTIGIMASTVFYMLCGVLGYIAFGNDAPRYFLTGFGFHDPFWLIDVVNVCTVIHLLGAYQVYKFQRPLLLTSTLIQTYQKPIILNNTEVPKEKRDCVLDRVFKHQPLPLPAPPVESVTLPSTSHGQPEQMPKPKPASPALSTSTSNEPDISKIGTENLEQPQFTPPPAQEIIAAQKEDKAANLKPTYDDVTSSIKMEQRTQMEVNSGKKR